ncbi:MAG: YggT family protein [Saprospiraceae bacterium]|nr:YggT family protein [Saprospiraceae bacterium]
MRIVISYLANIFIIGLFLYSKLLPYKDKLNNQYKGIFNFFNTIFSPLLNLLKRFIKPFQVGQGLAVDMTQIVLLLILLLIANTF